MKSLKCKSKQELLGTNFPSYQVRYLTVPITLLQYQSIYQFQSTPMLTDFFFKKRTIIIIIIIKRRFPFNPSHFLSYFYCQTPVPPPLSNLNQQKAKKKISTVKFNPKINTKWGFSCIHAKHKVYKWHGKYLVKHKNDTRKKIKDWQGRISKIFYSSRGTFLTFWGFARLQAVAFTKDFDCLFHLKYDIS